MNDITVPGASKKRILYAIVFFVVLVASNIVVYAVVNQIHAKDELAALKANFDKLSEKYELALKEVEGLKKEKTTILLDLNTVNERYRSLHESLVECQRTAFKNSDSGNSAPKASSENMSSNSTQNANIQQIMLPEPAWRNIPVRNEYDKDNGCYIACYSHNSANSAYPIGQDMFVMGVIRVEGHYAQRICLPKGYENKDISAELYFKDKCTKHLSHACQRNTCWAGGDTGGWFGF